MYYKFHFIYKTINLLNNKIYVGRHSTNNIDDGYLGSGTILNKSIKKNGKENFKREILEFCSSVDELLKSEKFWISKLNAVENGYNILFEDKFSSMNKGVNNAFYGKHHTEETKRILSYKAKNRERGVCPHCKKEMSISNLKRHHLSKCPSLRPLKEKINLGLTDEGRNRISLANKNKVISNETREKISNSRKGMKMKDSTKKKLSEFRIEYYKTHKHPRQKEKQIQIKEKIRRVSPNKGKLMKESSKEKLRQANLGKKRSRESVLKGIENNPKSRKVVQLDSGNNILNIFNSIKKASIATTCSTSSIYNCCIKKQNTSKSFIWRYYTDITID